MLIRWKQLSFVYLILAAYNFLSVIRGSESEKNFWFCWAWLVTFALSEICFKIVAKIRVKKAAHEINVLSSKRVSLEIISTIGVVITVLITFNPIDMWGNLFSIVTLVGVARAFSEEVLVKMDLMTEIMGGKIYECEYEMSNIKSAGFIYSENDLKDNDIVNIICGDILKVTK